MKITNCPIIAHYYNVTNNDGIEFLNLGNIPLVNNLCDTREKSLTCEKYPLAVQFFPKSKLICLTELIDKDKLFTNYLYQSGVSKPYLNHCSDMYDYLSNIIDFKDNDLIVDVGGNDGSLLKEFYKKNSNFKLINIDPSTTFILLNKKEGIEYICDYFGTGIKLLNKAKLITSTNVFQHNITMRPFVKDIYNNLDDEGVWCLEFPYSFITLVTDNYDQIYHEHVYYFCLQNIIDIAYQEGLKVINVSYHDIHAGTLRVLIVKKSSQKQSDITVKSFINLEKSLTEEYCIEWGKNIINKIQKFKQFIIDLKSKGNKIACFGAAAKGCVFLNSCELDDTIIEFIIDDTPFKQNKFVPGTGIQIVNRETLKTTNIDYILILAHNFKDHIIESLKDQYKGKFIIMFPNIKII